MASSDQTPNHEPSVSAGSNDDGTLLGPTFSQTKPESGDDKLASDEKENADSKDELEDAKANLISREKGIASGDRALVEKEEVSKEPGSDLNNRNNALKRGESEQACDLVRHESDLQQKEEDHLSAREEKVSTAGKRLSKGKNTGLADLIAALQENDKFQEEISSLRRDLERQKQMTETLKSELEDLLRRQGSGGNTIPSSMRKPLKLTPQKTRPAGSLPRDFTRELAKRMEEGKKSLTALRERRPPRTAAMG